MKQYLIVVDMQKDFVDGALGSKEAGMIVDHVVEKIKGWQGPIIVTRDTHEENYLETREGKYLPVKHCIIHTDGWQIHEKVQEALDCKKDVTYVNKPTFGCVQLADIIGNKQGYSKDEYISAQDMEIELVGLCTDICVVSNAMLLKAEFPEVNISVDSQCCAGVSPESHDAALTTMKFCQINIL